MAIADRLNKLTSDITDTYLAIQEIGGTIPSDKNTNNIPSSIRSVYDNLPKVSDTGTSISLTPTLKGRLGSVLKGNTYQYTTAGKNLLDIISASVSNRGVDLSISNHTHLVLNGTATQNYPISRGTLNLVLNNSIPAGTYTFSATGTYNGTATHSIDWEFYDNDDNLIASNIQLGENTSSKTFTVTSPIKTIKFVRNMLTDRTIDFDLYLQLETGSTATSYEPYTGGQPAPSPSFPMDIQSATGTQTITISGKNKFDKDNLQQGNINPTTGEETSSTYAIKTNYINATSNENYYFSTTYLKSYNYILRIIEYDKNKNFIKGTTGNNNSNIGIQTTSTTKYIRVTMYNDETITPSTYETIFKNTQLEQNNSVTPYQSYITPVEKTVELGNIELNKISDYEDYITGTPNNWVLHKNIGKVVLDGSETWGSFSYTSGDTNFRVQNDTRLPNILTPPTNPAQLYCNYFKAINRDNAYAKTEVGIAQYGLALGTIFICSPISILSEQTLNGWKNWLSTHNIEVLYPLATETTEPITDTTLISQLNELYYLQSNDDTTNIDVAGDLPMRITASAIKGA